LGNCGLPGVLPYMLSLTPSCSYCCIVPSLPLSYIVVVFILYYDITVNVHVTIGMVDAATDLWPKSFAKTCCNCCGHVQLLRGRCLCLTYVWNLVVRRTGNAATSAILADICLGTLWCGVRVTRPHIAVNANLQLGTLWCSVRVTRPHSAVSANLQFGTLWCGVRVTRPQ
jgi:hypothetical protein